MKEDKEYSSIEIECACGVVLRRSILDDAPCDQTLTCSCGRVHSFRTRQREHRREIRNMFASMLMYGNCYSHLSDEAWQMLYEYFTI